MSLVLKDVCYTVHKAVSHRSPLSHEAMSHPRPLHELLTRTSTIPDGAKMAKTSVPPAEYFLSSLGCWRKLWISGNSDCTSTLPHFTTDPLHKHHFQARRKCLELKSFGVSPRPALILPYSSSQISKWFSPRSDHESNGASIRLSTARILVES